MQTRQHLSCAQAKKRFVEWASLFSEKIFVQIAVYCDESGTGGFDKKGKDPIPTVYGYIAHVDYWVNEFHSEWQAVLDEYKVPYFHFYELTKKGREDSESPYHKWSDSKVDYFLDDLSIVAGRVAVPCGSHGTLKGGKDPYKKIFELFFKDCFNRIEEHWPNFNERVDFFFEFNNRKWSNQILDVAVEFGKKEKRLGTPAFPKWNDTINGLPLQAADLLAFSQRQSAAYFFENNRRVRESRIIDFALLRNLFPKGHPHRISNLDDRGQAKLVRRFRDKKDIRDVSNDINRLPKKDFFPMEFLKEYRELGKKLNL